jgi:LmbE family N-acetylglucosaminyl deacetylase
MNPERGVLARLLGGLTLGWSETPGGRMRLRRAASAAVRGGLRLRSRRFPADALSPVVVLSPHPDDESFGCGGTIAAMVGGGASVAVVFVTDGGGSHPGHPVASPAVLAARRKAEALAATALLGVVPGNLTFLGASDGTLGRLGPRQAEELVRQLAQLLGRLGPQALLLPGRRDGSSEHDAAHALAMRAVAENGLRPRILEFPVWSWWNPLLLIGPLLKCRRIWRVDLGSARALKAAAVSAYPSQTQPIAPDPSAALPAGFASMFLGEAEFLFEW